MENHNLFEIATRKKIRFQYHGMITVEELWDLSVEKLDSIYKELNVQMKQANEESLLAKQSKEAEMIHIKIEIVRHIVDVKLKEKKAKEEEAALKKRNQRIAEIIADKEDEALKNMPIDELKKLIQE